LAKELRPGFTITVEPGVYFIPALIDRWRAEDRHADFIDYQAVSRYRDFGGVRIEDDVLITGDGRRVLGPPIPKTVEDVELAMTPEV
jgi:Xaa-Pro aminopeptidase